MRRTPLVARWQAALQASETEEGKPLRRRRARMSLSQGLGLSPPPKLDPFLVGLENGEFEMAMLYQQPDPDSLVEASVQYYRGYCSACGDLADPKIEQRIRDDIRAGIACLPQIKANGGRA